MTDQIKWSQILLHCLFSGLAASFMGAFAHMGLAHQAVSRLVGYDMQEFFGFLMLGFAAAGFVGNLFYWPLRERVQHDMKWGGRQSQLEWIVPDIVAFPAAVVGYFISMASV